MRLKDVFRRPILRKASGIGRRLQIENLEDRCLLSYSVTDLGVLDGTSASAATAINASGQVVGGSGQLVERNFVSQQGILYQDGALTALPTLGGPYNIAFGVNDAGQVVGEVDLPGTYVVHGFVYQDGVLTELLPLGGSNLAYCTAFAVNNAGQVVGYSNTGTGVTHAVLWENGVATDLGALGGNGDSQATGINDAGQVAGSTDVSGAPGYHAFRYSGGVMQDLGTLPDYDGSVGQAINAAGQVVGYAFRLQQGFVDHAFLYDGTQMYDLGTLPGQLQSEALGINSFGQVVGWSGKGAGFSTKSHAFLYTDGVMTDLNTLIPADSGWKLMQATAINDAGQIVGYGINADNATHAFLLTPSDFGAAPHQFRMDPLTAQGLAAKPLSGFTAPNVSGSFVQPDNAQALGADSNIMGRIVPPPAAETQLIASGNTALADLAFAPPGLGTLGGSIGGTDDLGGLWVNPQSRSKCWTNPNCR
jgi:probable HAF family extracellular repeat protein